MDLEAMRGFEPRLPVWLGGCATVTSTWLCLPGGAAALAWLRLWGVRFPIYIKNSDLPSVGLCKAVVVCTVVEVVACDGDVWGVASDVGADCVVEFGGYFAEYFFCPVVVSCHAEEEHEDDEGDDGFWFGFHMTLDLVINRSMSSMW